MTIQSDPNKPTLDGVRQQILDWRAEHPAPTPFPAQVWDGAVQLVKEFGCGPTARALKLDYGCLKKRAGVASTRSKPKEEAPLFFELFPAATLSIQSCVVTLDTNRGGKVRVELGSSTPSALAAFVKELGV